MGLDEELEHPSIEGKDWRAVPIELIERVQAALRAGQGRDGDNEFLKAMNTGFREGVEAAAKFCFDYADALRNKNASASFAAKCCADGVSALQPAEPAKDDLCHDCGATNGVHDETCPEAAASTAEQILRELVAVEDLRLKMERGGFFYGHDPYANVAEARADYFKRNEAAWSAARAWLGGRNG